jgi:hypothetical protein
MMHLLYVDPGSGSYFLQVIIAAVLGLLFYFKNAWAWIKSLFVKQPPPDNEEPKDEQQ